MNIDVHTLLSLALVNLSQLPKCSCIYFVIQDSRIIYIGQTTNLADRWTGHHKLSQLIPILYEDA
ncbi:MAG: GIY-YIG nuclease family protein [Nostoc sp.]|uniref:GIY-YIG nuclease family protein n=1 Tax=Nostoc sp. TaxID=1180 RepID=UPI002FF61D71